MTQILKHLQKVVKLSYFYITPNGY